MAKPQKKNASQDDEEEDSKIFPQRLMEILGDERNQEAIGWLPHGRAFVIKKRDLFAENVMPRYFSRKAKYSSFTRKLNRWNFVRVSSGPELGAYYHEFFLRDKPHLAAQMFCKNARTMLAMNSSLEAPTAENVKAAPQPAVPQLTNQAQAQVPAMGASSQMPMPPITPALLQALQKDPTAQNNNSAKMSQLQAYAPTNVRLLEMHIMQQEQANRILYEHAMALSMQQRQEQQAKLVHEQQRLGQMRQLMQMRNQQRAQTSPTSKRASAA